MPSLRLRNKSSNYLIYFCTGVNVAIMNQVGQRQGRRGDIWLDIWKPHRVVRPWGVGNERVRCFAQKGTRMTRSQEGQLGLVLATLAAGILALVFGQNVQEPAKRGFVSLREQAPNGR